MKVALVSPYDLGRPGGVQDQVGKLAAWLEADGHEATVLAPGSSSEGTAISQFVSLGSSRLVRANRSAAPVVVNPAVVRRVKAAVDETDADVVHVHEPFMPIVGPAALLGTGRPVVATFHADPSSLIRRSYRTMAPVIRRLLRNAEVTAVSPVSGGALPPGVDVTLVPNGIDVDRYRHPNVERTPHQVVFVGRDEPRKGLADLLTAWPRIRTAVPAAELVVVGAEGSPHTTGGGIRFLGRVDEDTKIRTLRSSALLCAPNTGGESFGIILTEAMAAGCAVVASAIPGFVHVLADSGRLIAPGDPDGLGDAVVSIFTDETTLSLLAEQGGRRVQVFDRRTVLDGYLDAYRRALSRP